MSIGQKEDASIVKICSFDPDTVKLAPFDIQETPRGHPGADEMLVTIQH